MLRTAEIIQHYYIYLGELKMGNSDIFKEIGNKSLIENITQTQNSLKTIYKNINPAFDFDVFLKMVQYNIATGNIDEEALNFEWTKYTSSSSYDPNIPLLRGTILNELAKMAHDLQHTNQAWAFALSASSLAVQASTHSLLISAPSILQNNLRERARTGALARFEKHPQPAKEQAMKLMREKCPVGGWKDIQSAAFAIKSELSEFINSNQLLLRPVLIEDTIKKWIKDDAEFEESFKELQTPTILQ